MTLLGCLFFFAIPIASYAELLSVKAHLIRGYRFLPPLEIHFIETIDNVRYLQLCIGLCDQDDACRTVDYDFQSKRCRLFESLASAGTQQAHATATIAALDYCENEPQTEPDYVCARQATYSLQQIFDLLSAVSPISLTNTDRGIALTRYGIYTSSGSGHFSFFTPSGTYLPLVGTSVENTNLNLGLPTQVVLTRWTTHQAVLFTNIGTLSQPNFTETRVFALGASPYGCAVNAQYVYAAFLDGGTPLRVFDINTGTLMFDDASRNSVGYRPAVTFWKNSVFVLDQYKATEYSSTGVFQRSWPYFNGYQASIRHHIDHDYAGRRYVCNGGGSFPGLFALTQNFTQLGQAYSSCYRGGHVHISKTRVMLAIASSNEGGFMKTITI